MPLELLALPCGEAAFGVRRHDAALIVQYSRREETFAFHAEVLQQRTRKIAQP
jgi:hypothetical protein